MKKKEASSDIESTWLAFMSTGKIDSDALRPEIRESWIRCRKLGINPYDGTSPTVLSPSDLSALLLKKKDLIEAAVPFMKRISKVISYSDFFVVLTDEQGFILEIILTPDIQEELTKAMTNYKPGARWLEQDVGTNGIDLVIRSKKPFQILGAEHYAITHHPASCVSAPIFNAKNELTGTLTASGLSQATHKHTMAMILSGVEVISDEIRLREINNQLTITNNRLTNVLTSMSDGVIVTDKHGIIQQVNPVVEHMIGHSIETNRHAVSEFYNDESSYDNDVLGKGLSYNVKEVSIKSKSHSSHVLATANPIKDEQEQIVGGIIVLTPAAKIQKLIKRYASTSARFQLKDIIGQSASMLAVLNMAERASKKSNTILLEGESGTGKEIIAQAIHNNSPRKNGPFVAINCGALPRDLISSELFGYVEGTFTGAKKEGRPGKFELANGGTIFLDEVAEMPLEQQVNLLRVLQERTITRIGSIYEIPVNVMIICATNKSLQMEVIRNNFRQDLYYRLNVISIRIPPLRDRLEDIPLLADFFVSSMSNPGDRSKIALAPEVLECFYHYRWPGNVRELQNVIEKMMLFCDGNILGLERLPAEIPLIPTAKSTPPPLASRSQDFLHSTRKSKKDKKNDDERQQLLLLLSQSGGNISAIAKIMGVNRCTVYRKMKRHNIIHDDLETE